jgi:hypothetical protein
MFVSTTPEGRRCPCPIAPVPELTERRRFIVGDDAIFGMEISFHVGVTAG